MTYTLLEVERAAEETGIDQPLAQALLEALQGPRYRQSNAQNEATAYQDMTQGLTALYDTLGTWRRVAEAVGLSKAYAWRVAHGTLVPSAEAMARYRTYMGGVSQR